jgi:protein TonB
VKAKLSVASLWLGLMAATGFAVIVCPSPAMAQQESKTDELTRKAKTKISPVYPDVARRMSITGTVRLAVVVSPNGTVRSAKAVGGHPILVDAAMDAMKRWKFEPAPVESSGIVEFKFQPQN